MEKDRKQSTDNLDTNETFKNGLTKGESHDKGGIPMRVKSTNQMIEMEGGEGVLNKTNMADPTKFEFEGKELNTCEIVSELNSNKNNGVEIDCDGVVTQKNEFEDGGKINNDRNKNMDKMIDLFVDYKNMPKQLELVINNFTKQYGDDIDSLDFADLEMLKRAVNKIGYTFDVGLDGFPFGLRPFNVSINQLQNYQNYTPNTKKKDILYEFGGDIEVKKYDEKIPEDIYISLLGDFDNDGIRNADDLEPTIKSSIQVEEVSLANEMNEIIKYRNSFVSTRNDILKKIKQIDCGKIKCEIKSRIKTPFSIINKLKRRSLTSPKDLATLNKQAEQKIKDKSLTGLDLYKGLTDVLGFAIIVEDYKQLQKVQKIIDDGELGSVLEKEDFYIKDNNGYRAIHYLLGTENTDGIIIPYELQLKTDRVNKLSKITHTIYKMGIMDSKENDRIAQKVEKADKGNLEMQKEIDVELKNVELLTKMLTLKSNKFNRGGSVEIKNSVEITKQPKIQLDYIEQIKKDIGVSGAEVSQAISEYEFILNKKQNKEKFKIGGQVKKLESILITLKENFEASLYDSETGKFKGLLPISKQQLNNFIFLQKDPRTSTFLYPQTNYSFVIPNAIIDIKGFSKQYMKEGGSITPYQSYDQKLNSNDIDILELLRITPSNMLIHQDLELISTFRGDNVVNHLSNQLITKLFGLMFKFHTISTSIKSILIKNNGTGNLLSLAPSYIHKVFVSFEDTEFKMIEEKINFAQNKQITNYYNGIDKIDAIIYVYPKINPTEEILTDYYKNNPNTLISIGVAEFNSINDYNNFKVEAENKILNVMVDKTIYQINSGITNLGKFTIIYIINKI